MRLLPLFSAMAALSACGGPPAETAPADPAPAPAVPSETSTDRALPLPAGQHCYFRDSTDVTEGLELTVTETGDISGSSYGSIHQEAEAYYASFDIELTSGSVSEDGLVTFESVTRVDGDTQIGTMSWSITPDAAAPEGFLDEPMQPAACEGLVERIFPQPGEDQAQ